MPKTTLERPPGQGIVTLGRTFVVSLSLASAVVGCGARRQEPERAGRATAVADAGSTPRVAPLGALPPFAKMPPPGVRGSNKAQVKPDQAFARCDDVAGRGAVDPLAHLARVAEACAGASKMRATGAPLRGHLGEGDPAAPHKVRVEAKRCYRAYVATEETIRDAVVVLRDSAGDVVAESSGVALPPSGAACFEVADEATVLVSVGRGRGAYALQIASD